MTVTFEEFIDQFINSEQSQSLPPPPSQPPQPQPQLYENIEWIKILYNNYIETNTPFISFEKIQEQYPNIIYFITKSKSTFLLQLLKYGENINTLVIDKHTNKQFILYLCKINTNTICGPSLFSDACLCENIKVAQTLMNEPIDLELYDYEFINDLFRKVCLRGDLTTAKWLWSKRNEGKCNINIHNNQDSLFCDVCINGLLEIAKWLWFLNKEENSPDEIHSCSKIDLETSDVFFETCVFGHIEIAKWLMSLGEYIDFHQENDILFYYLCIWRRIEIMKWLWSFGPTSDMYDHLEEYSFHFKVNFLK